MGNTSIVRTVLRHTTHGTDSDRLIKLVSKERATDQSPQLVSEYSIRNSQPTLIACGLICGMESDPTCCTDLFSADCAALYCVNQPDLIR
jgi:hypothetical protein